MYLEMDRIHKSFGQDENRQEVLHGITCGIEEGSICVMLGPSGSGKSTLLNIIGGIETVDSGSITIDGNEITGRKESVLSKYRREYLGYVFQSYNLIPNLTAKENIEVGAYLSKDPLPVEELLNVLGLLEHKDKIPSQLSGGQQQRIAIGRAIAKKPGVLLCDEPTGALDYSTSKEILKLIEEINRKYKTTVVLVTHNEALKDMADVVLYMKDGRITAQDKNETKTPVEELEW